MSVGKARTVRLFVFVVFVVFVTLVVYLVGLYVNNKNYQEKLVSCNQLYQKIAINKLISENTDKCQDKKTINEISALISNFQVQYDTFDLKVQKMSSEINADIIENNFFRQKLKGVLELVEVQNNTSSVTVGLSLSSSANLTLREQEAKLLVKSDQIKANKAKVQELLKFQMNEVESKLKVFPELKTSQTGIFLTDYYNQNLKAQVLNYGLFLNNVTELNKSINDKAIELEKVNRELALKIQANQYKTFTSNEFRALYEEMVYEKTNPPVKDLVVYALREANLKVSQIAEKRGYKKRVTAIESGLQSIGSQKLQLEAREALVQLIQNASKDGIDLSLISGYRSVDDQIYLFTTRLGVSSNADLIASERVDTQIDKVLETTAAPTYSRHHTGYTFDLGCSSIDFTDFKNTNCYEWISKDNFYQAKKLGLIPSYPEGVEKQGPNPEAWEYVWIGTGKLKNF